MGSKIQPVDSLDIEDEDTCSPEEINNLFKHKYKIHDEPAVTYDNSYVLSLTKDDSFTCVAAGLSNGSVRLFEVNSAQGLYIEPPGKNLSICGLRFVDETSNLLLVGTTNGLVRLLDLRARGEVSRFVNNPMDAKEPRDIACFDRNSNSRLLVMGTEQRNENVYLLIYDLRTSNELFRYEDSHHDDVTSLSFHPEFADILCSGSTDGLINIFDLQTTDESEAILKTVYTDSSVQRVRWHKTQDQNYIVSCTTHTNLCKTFNFNGDLVADFDRLKITESVKRRNEDNCNLVGCHSTADNNILLITGTNSHNGSVLRSCKIQNNQLNPYANFDGNKQVVRESVFDSKTNILITAGEGGYVTLWTPLNWESAVSSTKEDVASLPSSDEETDDVAVQDNDTCTPFELQQHFCQKYVIQDESAVTLKKNYILSLAKDVSFTRLAAGLSDGSVHLFDISSERGLSYSSPDCISAPPSKDSKNGMSICGVRFVDETPNLLLIGTTNNLVRLFDLRTQKPVASFQNNIESDTESVTMSNRIVCFDRNSNSRILCMGSEQYHNNVFLMFYDLRERRQLGGYFESHQDDVTTLCFHPQNPDFLCSGSTDGLINIYDIQKPTEDEALLTTLNTVSSVHKVNWHKNVYDKDVISCITHTNDLKMYECPEGDLIADFGRAHITESMKRQAVENCNVINCHNLEEGRPFLLTGSYLNKGEILRSLLVQNKQLLPDIDFQGNKQIVRESVFDSRTNVLITAGESGIVTLWAKQISASSGDRHLKAQKKKNYKTTPY